MVWNGSCTGISLEEVEEIWKLVIFFTRGFLNTEYLKEDICGHRSIINV